MSGFRSRWTKCRPLRSLPLSTCLDHNQDGSGNTLEVFWGGGFLALGEDPSRAEGSSTVHSFRGSEVVWFWVLVTLPSRFDDGVPDHPW